MYSGKIYKLVSTVEGNNEVYIGKTTSTLKSRKSEHKSDSRREPNRRVYQEFNHTNWDTVDIVLVEIVNYNDKDELSARERYWIDTISTLNKSLPLRTKTEYNKTEQARQARGRYNKTEQNKHYMKQYSEEYMKSEQARHQHNRIVICECGMSIVRRSVPRHTESKKHKQYLCLIDFINM